MMNTISTYPIIEMSDWFDENKARKIQRDIKKEFKTLKTYVSEQTKECKSRRKTFDIGSLIGKCVQIVSDIDEHRKKYLEDLSNARSKSPRRTRIAGMSDSLNTDVLKFRFDDFVIVDVYKKWVMLMPKNTTTNTKYKFYYDEVLIKR